MLILRAFGLLGLFGLSCGCIFIVESFVRLLTSYLFPVVLCQVSVGVVVALALPLLAPSSLFCRPRDDVFPDMALIGTGHWLLLPKASLCACCHMKPRTLMMEPLS